MHARVPSLALASLALLAGCVADRLVDTPWARQAASVVSSDTPDPLTRKRPFADLGPAAERQRDPLDSLSGLGPEDLGDVSVELKDGCYTLQSEVVLRPERLEISGQGPHRTRLELDSDTIGTLQVGGAQEVVLRDLTIVGESGGGLFLSDCPHVIVENVHFAGARYGLRLRDSVAAISSSVFAGCQTGVLLQRDSRLSVRETTFSKCWVAIDGGPVEAESTVFVENRKVLAGSLDRRSGILGCVFAGAEQELSWSGHPRLATGNLARPRDVGDRLGTETNGVLLSLDDFPEHAQIPPTMDVVAVHLALARSAKRGDSDPPEKVRQEAIEAADRYAQAAQRALKSKDVAAARVAARIALRYYGDAPLDRAPQALIDVADLVRE